MEDNARKFVVDAVDSEFLKNNNASSFLLVVDWLVTQEDSEKKVVYKKFDSGETQFLLVEKVINNGNRTTNKKKLTESEYKELLKSSTVHLEKRRHEFSFMQNGVLFSMKYDQFGGEKLQTLEVDAANEGDRGNFKPEDFPYRLIEVTGDMRYYGYRVARMI
jgi:hypothetical protein